MEMLADVGLADVGRGNFKGCGQMRARVDIGGQLTVEARIGERTYTVIPMYPRNSSQLREQDYYS
jgi:hypothetical protein